MAEFKEKAEKEYIRDKAEADKIIEALDNKIYLCKEQLKIKNEEGKSKDDLILQLNEEIMNLKKDSEESEKVLIKVHDKLKSFTKLNTEYKELKKKYLALKNN